MARKNTDRIPPVFAWTWKIRDHKGRWALCYWAQPTRNHLLAYGHSKPSPEAVPVRIVMTAALAAHPKRKPRKESTDG